MVEGEGAVCRQARGATMRGGSSGGRRAGLHLPGGPLPPVLESQHLNPPPPRSWLPACSGYEGVREIQKRLTNTMGWSATSGMVDNWVYDEVSVLLLQRMLLLQLIPGPVGAVAAALVPGLPWLLATVAAGGTPVAYS